MHYQRLYGVNNSPNRDEGVSVTKGIAIILMVIGHLENPERTDPSSHVSLTPLAIF